MPVRDDLGIRMKTFYEGISKTQLTRRTPVCIRLDGKAFHTFTKGMAKPFDDILIKTMQETMKYLCENIQGCVLGYTQSDEITLILVDYKKLTSSAWFDYEVQKMCSVAASMATLAFNREFAYEVEEYTRWVNETNQPKEIVDYCNNLQLKLFKAMFDARVFNIPKEEVCNLLYWRQLDATRNSIQMLGQSQFSHKELQNKSCNVIQDMLMVEREMNWNDLATVKKRGSCCIKEKYLVGETERSRWLVDMEIPIFNQDRDYVDKLIYIGDN